MSSIRIAFLGTPIFARVHLQALLDDPHFEVVGVVTQPDRPSGRKLKLTPSPVKELALEKNIEVLSPESIKDSDVINTISSWKAEAAVVVAYGQLVPQKFLDLFPLKVVNVHGSLLPRWRGAAPIQRALEAGDLTSGATLQVMTKKMDAGAIIGAYSIPITKNMNAQELHDSLLPLGVKLLHIDFMDYLRGNLSTVPQNEAEITFAKKIENTEARIDWALDAQVIHNKVRGFFMGPGTYCTVQDKKLKILRTEVVNKEFNREPGTLVTVNRDEIWVACGSNILKVIEVQPESRPRMNVKEFLLGHPQGEGSQWK